ncbi:unnamed protein product [Spodoptera exigua]|uniref:Uncharacterized protein n=1 Tax=Spodoptera exigua TaxID=7107 RepID=A0A922SIZ6_SPOEX|nr:hypothetical protein HF086_012956 [Spodoptera exigua]CAH0694572.1 unnamed protein product [Spodoptera exigua]
MAFVKNILLLFAILIPATILAQNGTDVPPSSEGPDGPSSDIPDGGSTEPPMPSSASGPFDHFSFKPPKFDWPSLPGIFGGGSRHKRAANEPVDAEHARQDHAFFRRVIRCNFLTEVNNS